MASKEDKTEHPTAKRLKDARKLDVIAYDEMLELASLGSKVMQARSVEFAKKYGVVFEVRSSFNDNPGTIVKEEVASMEDVVVRGVAVDRNQAKVIVSNILDKPGSAKRVRLEEPVPGLRTELALVPEDQPLEGDLTLEVGDRTWDAVHTPGHTQGHYVFADRTAGLLFAGDHVLPTITPSIGFEPVPATLPLGDFLASLAKVRALPDLALLPAHGPVTTSTHARVDELTAHHASAEARRAYLARKGVSA